MKIMISKVLIILFDLFYLVAVFYVALLLSNNSNSFEVQKFTFVFVIILALLYFEKVYNFRYDFWQDTFKVFRALIISFLIILSLLTLTKTHLEYSRLFIALYFILLFVTLPIFKRYAKKIIFLLPFCKQKILILGKESEVIIFKKELQKNWYLGQVYSKKRYEKVIIISQGIEEERLHTLIDEYVKITSEIFVVPYLKDINFMNSDILEYSNIRRNTIQVQNKLLVKRNIWIKNLFDFVVTLMITPLFLFVHILISMAIILNSRGTVFFKQYRLGKDDNDFECYKYRTMYENSEDILKNYLKNNPDEIEYYKEYHKYKNDPRITKVGKFLRISSLDELPQIINVLKGDMSLVGPRPYMLNESDKLGKDKDFICKVKPGITGLWQVSGRNNLTFKERNGLEVWYIKNWSLWADFVILIKTFKVVFSKIGAK
ncbi:MAG: exopolysaccharide biosynthesis polyprenyl glycosylphosphotransferase [Campylobacteraceae bacterium]|nr:exopolysaccharide biosynthesis polyprenyl glycosylphosphotransferase [Campylobacteraceae bacterium]